MWDPATTHDPFVSWKDKRQQLGNSDTCPRPTRGLSQCLTKMLGATGANPTRHNNIVTHAHAPSPTPAVYRGRGPAADLDAARDRLTGVVLGVAEAAGAARREDVGVHGLRREGRPALTGGWAVLSARLWCAALSTNVWCDNAFSIWCVVRPIRHLAEEVLQRPPAPTRHLPGGERLPRAVGDRRAVLQGAPAAGRPAAPKPNTTGRKGHCVSIARHRGGYWCDHIIDNPSYS
jgi:hypothetical protein